MTKITEWIRKVFGPRHPRPDEAAPGDEAVELEPEGRKGGFKVTRFQHTPNPEAGQFILSRQVVRTGGTRTFASRETAGDDPFAGELFKIFGVESLFLKENFLTVTKSPVVAWTNLMPLIQEGVERSLHYYATADEDALPKPKASGSLLEEVDVEDFPDFSDEQKGSIIDAVLDHAIRPALANDGGGITLIQVEGNLVKVHYQGACGTCPSSTTGTLQYIETFLQDTLDKNLKVETVNAPVL
ncbi:MAG: NifU family protein [Nitrospinaceae bacterium]